MSDRGLKFRFYRVQKIVKEVLLVAKGDYQKALRLVEQMKPKNDSERFDIVHAKAELERMNLLKVVGSAKVEETGQVMTVYSSSNDGKPRIALCGRMQKLVTDDVEARDHLLALLGMMPTGGVE